MSASSPKIAQVVCTYPPYHGGMGRVAYEYTERLRARGYNVHVFTSQVGAPPSPAFAEASSGRPSLPLAGEGVHDPEYVHRIPAIVSIGNAGVMPSLYRRLSGFDLVHLHYPFFGGAEPVVVRRALRDDQGLVMTYHMDATASGWRGAIFEVHKHLMFPWIAKRVDRILVSSKEYAETSALSDLPRVMDRVEIHPFGVDLEKFRPRPPSSLPTHTPACRQAGSLSSRGGITPNLLFVGGLDKAHHFKGLAVLLEALKTIELPFTLTVVGSGELKSTYEALTTQLDLHNRVMFVGSVSQKDLPRYYQEADIHVLPSTRRAEAFGLVALEAASSGIPTIASDLPGVNSVVIDGQTGLLVPPEDIDALAQAINLLLTRADVREKFGEAARLNAELRYAWDPLITNLERTYRSVLDQQSSRTY